jgi:uncharacterized membrane protein YfcA
MMTNEFWFLILLPVIAVLYASVGHGGASGYLALMSLFSFAPEKLKPTALLLNLFVSGISFVQFWKAGYHNWKLFLAFALGSIPFAFLGGMTNVNAHWFKLILGVFLILAVIRMLFQVKVKEHRDVNFWFALLIGAGIGFLSGMIGIGGGIILSPIILLLGWGSVKESAAVSALFIWVNSLAGLIGNYLVNGNQYDQQSIIFVVLAILGGLIGGHLGSRQFNLKVLKYVLMVVLISASVKLIWF